jgi:REP element-mobilizing transposase RayT
VARQARAQAASGLHHVWTRGIDGIVLFRDDRDRADFLERLADAVAEACVECLAWVLLSTHLHAIVRADARPLSALMQRVKTGLAVRFNLRHGRQGPVFQSRFGSRVVQDDADFLNLLRYVHRNPLEAGLVAGLRTLERYPWTSYGALLGRRPPHPFESVSACLSLLDGDEAAARERLRGAMARAEETPAAAGAASDEHRLDALIHAVSADLGVPHAALRRGARDAPVSRARERVCRIAVKELHIRPAEVARALGVTRAAVTFALRRQPRRESY